MICLWRRFKGKEKHDNEFAILQGFSIGEQSEINGENEHKRTSSLICMLNRRERDNKVRTIVLDVLEGEIMILFFLEKSNEYKYLFHFSKSQLRYCSMSQFHICVFNFDKHI